MSSFADNRVVRLPERPAGSVIPKITCPVCAQHMRLATIEPAEFHHTERMTFTCECGFEYRQSPAAAAERAL